MIDWLIEVQPSGVRLPAGLAASAGQSRARRHGNVLGAARPDWPVRPLLQRHRLRWRQRWRQERHGWQVRAHVIISGRRQNQSTCVLLSQHRRRSAARRSLDCIGWYFINSTGLGCSYREKWNVYICINKNFTSRSFVRTDPRDILYSTERTNFSLFPHFCAAVSSLVHSVLCDLAVQKLKLCVYYIH